MKPTMFTQPNQPQEIVFDAMEAELASMVEVAFEEVSLSVSSFKAERFEDSLQVKLILDGNQRTEFEQRLKNLQQHFAVPTPSIAPLQMQDWVAQVQKHFKPMRAGRYYIYGSHIETPPPLSATPILLDAGAAFGTGEHETTAGCMMAMDELFHARRYQRVLDMGCGSGVLAIAAAKSLHVPVTAIDNDAVSVKVARENVRRNKVAAHVKLQCGDGYSTALVHGKYDLIIANILARPLMYMAQDLRKYLRHGGTAVLSGLLNRQEEMVLWAHKQAGLHLVKRKRVGPWSVLVLRG